MGFVALNGLRQATALLTRLRVGTGGVSSESVALGVPWFPVVGMFVGLAAAGVYALARLGLPAVVSATLSVAFSIWFTGAFHEDGLADTADALGSGAYGIQAANILKDPTLGTFGVLVLVLAVLLRIGALAAIDAAAAVAALPAAHALGRAGASALLGARDAGADGLGASLMSVVSRRQIGVGVVVGALLAVATLGPLAPAAVVVAGLSTFGVARITRRRFDGVTGDVIGAAEQIGEIGVLLVTVVAIRRGWLTVPWWKGL